MNNEVRYEKKDICFYLCESQYILGLIFSKLE